MKIALMASTPAWKPTARFKNSAAKAAQGGVDYGILLCSFR